MNIQTKFNIDDRVFVRPGKAIYSGKITEISAVVDRKGDIDISYAVSGFGQFAFNKVYASLKEVSDAIGLKAD